MFAAHSLHEGRGKRARDVDDIYHTEEQQVTLHKICVEPDFLSA